MQGLFGEDEYYDEQNYDYGEEEDMYEGGEDEDPFDIERKLDMAEKLKEEIEFGKVEEFYNIRFTSRLLQLVNLLASVATNNAYASHVLFNIAHP